MLVELWFWWQTLIAFFSYNVCKTMKTTSPRFQNLHDFSIFQNLPLSVIICFVANSTYTLPYSHQDNFFETIKTTNSIFQNKHDFQIIKTCKIEWLSANIVWRSIDWDLSQGRRSNFENKRKLDSASSLSLKSCFAAGGRIWKGSLQDVVRIGWNLKRLSFYTNAAW